MPLACTPEPTERRAGLRCRREVRSRVSSRDVGAADREDRRVSRSRTPTTQWDDDRRAGPRRRRRSRTPRRAADDGRRADVRVRSTIATGSSGRRPPWVRPSAASRARLLHRLKQHTARTVFIHFGQGKWYPGEQLPRWALDCYWRNDGEAAWADPSLLCRSSNSRTDTAQPTRSDSSRRWPRSWASPTRTCRGLRRRLVLPVARTTAAGERRSLRRPLDDEIERARLHALFERRVSTRSSATCCRFARGGPTRAGRRDRGSCAVSGCILMPGDSPMGLRLPLDSLPWSAEGDRVTNSATRSVRRTRAACHGASRAAAVRRQRAAKARRSAEARERSLANGEPNPA